MLPLRPSMAWSKSSPALEARFLDALPSHPDAERKRMFGYAACFVRGNFFIGLHEENVVVRLPGDLKSKVPAGAAAFDPMKNGRLMKDWWVLPSKVAGDAKALARFVADAFPLVQKLPAKATKKKSAATPAKAAASKKPKKAAAPKKGKR